LDQLEDSAHALTEENKNLLGLNDQQVQELLLTDFIHYDEPEKYRENIPGYE
jgi:hypothetical protein